MIVRPAAPAADRSNIAARDWRSVLDDERGEATGWPGQPVLRLAQSPQSVDAQFLRHTGRSPSLYSTRGSSAGAFEWSVLQPSRSRSVSAWPDTSAGSFDRIPGDRDQWYFFSRLVERTAHVRRIREEYSERIDALRRYGESEEVAVEAASEHDFWYFIKSRSFTRKAQLVLMENGNLRAVWRDHGGSHLGLQFLGRNRAEYVIFTCRRATMDVSRVAGVDTLDGVARQIDAFDLASLVCM